MILDTSAIVAVVFREPDFERVQNKSGESRTVGIGVPTLLETGIVLSARMSEDARGLLGRFVVESGITTIPFGDTHFQVAVDGWLRYGRGRHPAALNFGDCMSYATATIAGEPLLCVGDDFSRTDIDLA